MYTSPPPPSGAGVNIQQPGGRGIVGTREHEGPGGGPARTDQMPTQSPGFLSWVKSG